MTPDTLRYYEKIGVIQEVHRTVSSIRDYDKATIGRAENAVSMRSIGVPAERIIEYVRLFGRTGQAKQKRANDQILPPEQGISAIANPPFRDGCLHSR